MQHLENANFRHFKMAAVPLKKLTRYFKRAGISLKTIWLWWQLYVCKEKCLKVTWKWYIRWGNVVLLEKVGLDWVDIENPWFTIRFVLCPRGYFKRPDQNVHPPGDTWVYRNQWSCHAWFDHVLTNLVLYYLSLLLRVSFRKAVVYVTDSFIIPNNTMISVGSR